MREFNHIHVVLCRPAESGNIGSVCRALKNMGFFSLRIVAPEKPIIAEHVKMMAVHAFDLFEAASFYPDLPAALRDMAFCAGTTRRRGRKRKDISFPIQDFARDVWKRPGQIAIVFGNERTGLTDEELALCQLAVHIPTSDEFPSLNLAQAVQVVAWELFEAWPGRPCGRPLPIDAARCGQVAGDIVSRLGRAGFFRLPGQAPETAEFLRDTLARAALTASEAEYFHALFRKLTGMAFKTNLSLVPETKNKE
jgi:TrmH family RNA methyltransferase